MVDNLSVEDSFLPSHMKNEDIFNELFNTFLGEDSIEECLKKAEWLTNTLEDLPTQLPASSPTPISGPGTKRKITVKSEPSQDCSLNSGKDIGREKKRKTDDQQQKGILFSWKKDPHYELSALDCLGLNEDKALKKARRKIKNKISAQESRRKKKEYVEGLERRVSIFSQVNDDLKERLSELESINREMQEKIVMLTTSNSSTRINAFTQTDVSAV